jgi:4-hydroxy-tetrahydrodipicolinate synthase
MDMSKNFTGTGVAVVTPFKTDTSIDFKALERVVSHIINGGVDYLVVLGTTSEAVTLSPEEKEAVVSYVKEINNGRLPIVLGMGGNNTHQVENDIRSTDFEGIDGILSVAPYYNKPGQKGIYQHFKAISSASPVPVMLYNVPGRTSSNISADTCLKLAWDFDNIVAVKEASGDLTQVMNIVSRAPAGFQVISGDDLLTLPMIALGCTGVVSVLANAFPKEWSEMTDLALKSKNRQAADIHYKYLEMIGLLFEDGNPAGIKSVLNCLNLCQNTVRLPLTPVSRNTSTRISTLIQDLKLTI